MDRGEEYDDQAWFWDNVDETPGCWIWSGDFNNTGYGIVHRKKYHGGAHRAAYALEYGVELPKGICVLHRCDNPACVRPEHLYLGTHKDNSRDAVERGRLHGGQVRRRIRELLGLGANQRESATTDGSTACN